MNTKNAEINKGLIRFDIFLIGIANELQEQDDKYELHRLLNTLLSMELSDVEKLGLIETEYNISIDDRMSEYVSNMWNLSQEILKKFVDFFARTAYNISEQRILLGLSALLL